MRRNTLSGSDVASYYSHLASRRLTADSVDGFLTDWTALNARLMEEEARLEIGFHGDTADGDVDRRYRAFLSQILPPWRQGEHRLSEMLLAYRPVPDGLDVPLRQLQVAGGVFDERSVGLEVQERQLQMDYVRLRGDMAAPWSGSATPVAALRPSLQPERRLRERAWRSVADRELQDAPRTDKIWRALIELRNKMADISGCTNYTDLRWRRLGRRDYAPEDCISFHLAVEEFVSPVLVRLHEERRRLLGTRRLRPWDLETDPRHPFPVRSFASVDELVEMAAATLLRVDGRVAAQLAEMRARNRLDLGVRLHKAPGERYFDLPATGQTFLGAQLSGAAADLGAVWRGVGFAWARVEAAGFPFLPQRFAPLEVVALAGMALELLAFDRVGGDAGLEQAEVSRLDALHLERCLMRWTSEAMIDAFEHWAYANPVAASDPKACDAEWAGLWLRFLPAVDWTGLEHAFRSDRQRRSGPFLNPFTSLSGSLGRIGAIQIWERAAKDPLGAVADLRAALRLGNTVPLPELYRTAGAVFSLDEHTLRETVLAVEQALEERLSP